mgnify:CR=1 FL=1
MIFLYYKIYINKLMKEINGDLIKLAIEGHFDVIIHGCNCFHSMGAGIAKYIKMNFPESHIADKKTTYGNFRKLGTYSSANVLNNKLTVVNGYTQYYYGKKKINVDYYAIENLFKLIKKDFSGKRIGIPKIGAGLGGGNWKIISSIIEKEMKGEDISLVIY